MALHCVALAGGAGTRLWPLSTREHPKQLLPLFDGRSLLQRTLARMPVSVPLERRWLVVGEDQREASFKAAGGLPEEQILAEPEPKNTAPAIFLAAQRIRAVDPDPVIAVLPADQFVDDAAAFQQALMDAESMTRSHGMVVLGVKPTRAETGYGYIEVGEPAGPGFACQGFVEKPDEAKARSYLAGGRHLWNAGMFIFRFASLAAEANLQMAETWAEYEAWRGGGCKSDGLAGLYASANAVSFDYGIMEGAKNVALVALDAGWSDVGSYQTLLDALSRGGGGHSHGLVLSIDAHQNLLINMCEAPLVVLGIRDCVVVQTPEGSAVLPLAQSQRVRELVAGLGGLVPDA